MIRISKEKAASVARGIPEVFIRNFQYMAVSVILATAMIVAAQFLFYTFMPRSFFYTYYEAHSSRAIVGEPLVFFSEREINRQYDIRFLDVLKCKTSPESGNFKRVFGFASDSLTPEPVDRVSPTELQEKLNDGAGFTYGDQNMPYIPMSETTCFLETRVTMELPLGVTKTQDLVSETFDILNP